MRSILARPRGGAIPAMAPPLATRSRANPSTNRSPPPNPTPSRRSPLAPSSSPDRPARLGIELGNDVVSRLAANENAPHRSFRADAQRRSAALHLRLRRVRQVRPVPLAGVDDEQAAPSGRLEDGLARPHGRREE